MTKEEKKQQRLDAIGKIKPIIKYLSRFFTNKELTHYTGVSVTFIYKHLGKLGRRDADRNVIADSYIPEFEEVKKQLLILDKLRYKSVKKHVRVKTKLPKMISNKAPLTGIANQHNLMTIHKMNPFVELGRMM